MQLLRRRKKKTGERVILSYATAQMQFLCQIWRTTSFLFLVL